MSRSLRRLVTCAALAVTVAAPLMSVQTADAATKHHRRHAMKMRLRGSSQRPDYVGAPGFAGGPAVSQGPAYSPQPGILGGGGFLGTGVLPQTGVFTGVPVLGGFGF